MEHKRLKRLWARTVIVLFAAALLLYLIVWLGSSALGHGALIGLVVAGTTLLLAAAAVELVFLRCTNCGKTVARFAWKPGRTYYCPFCGKPFLFDDDPPDKTETTTKEEP